jgi:predicted SnoaL-like aldol condensation-catalyzing enzyme
MNYEREHNIDSSGRRAGINKIEIVRAYWASEKAKNLEEIITYFTKDIIIKTLTSTISGNNIVEFYDNFLKTYEETSITVNNSIEEGNQIAVEWTGRFVKITGEVKTPVGCHIFVFRNNKICKIQGYFNPQDF